MRVLFTTRDAFLCVRKLTIEEMGILVIFNGRLRFEKFKLRGKFPFLALLHSKQTEFVMPYILSIFRNATSILNPLDNEAPY
jgi:hypothetical protein